MLIFAPVEPVLIAVFFAIVLVTVVIAVNVAAKKRRESLAALAQRLGLMFEAGRDFQMAGRFGFLNRLAQGSNRYAFNTLWGNFREHAVYAFDYHYETHSRDSEGRQQTNDHYFSCLILMLERQFPELTIGREGLLSKIAQGLGYDDIDFESNEFSRTFCVRSKDKKFAYDFCHARMMEYLLQNQDLSIEVEASVLAIAFSRRLDAAQIEHNLNRLVQLRALMPKYLFS
ncbi:MAG TPA: hypothetical protein VJ063_04650 [Verrucomicrobiae bacterium]|nr:hypothetical protein [Verrucomicrobiae bacterium]